MITKRHFKKLPPRERRNRALEIVQDYYPEVTHVVDATSDLPFEVTADDVRKGVPKDHTNCPGAVSLKHQPQVTGAIVSKRSAYVICGTKATRYRTVESFTREAIVTDRGGSFAPGDYVLKAPKKGERLTDRHTGKTHNKSDRDKPAFQHVTTAVRTTLGLRAHIS
jgi:hypothetical protein